MENNIYASSVGITKKDIYIIKNDINTKVYIGQSVNSKERFISHCKSNNDNSAIDKAIKKYGKEHFWFEILESQIENYNEREIYWIKYYNSKVPFGYNIQDGGENPPVYYGENSPAAKISNQKVQELKSDLKNTKLSLSELSKKYNISKRQVLRINQGVSRAEINETYPIREEPNRNGKLSEEDVDSIIEILKYTYRFNGDIAREFGVEVHLISDINQGKVHKREDVQYPIRNWKSCGVILFTYEQVTEIINALSKTKESIASIAARYKVDRQAIENINRGKSKKYIREGLSYPLRKM